MAKVFLSSTCDDLDQLGYRAKALQAINQRQLTPESMEFWETRPQPSVDKCLEKVRASDVLVLVVAFRYGWIPPGQNGPDQRSITWMEVEYARKKPIPILPFFAAKEEGPLWELGERYRLSKAKTDAEFDELRMRAQLLDKFKATFGATDIGRFESPDDLLHKIYRALEPWAAPSGKQKLNDDRAYLAYLHDNSRHIDIPGISKGGKKFLDIDKFYIPLVTTQAEGEASVWVKMETARFAGAADPALRRLLRGGRDKHALLQETLKPGCRLLVEGEAGAGKSTFVKRIVFALCQTWCGHAPDAAEKFLGRKRPPYPIYLRAAHLSEHVRTNPGKLNADAPLWLADFLETRSKEFHWGLDSGFFDDKMTNSPCLVMIDGLDEAGDRTSRERLATIIANAAGIYPKSDFLVTSRPELESGSTGPAFSKRFSRVSIGPVERDSIRAFLDAWAGEYCSQDPAQAAAFRDELLSAAETQPEIAEMASNPVMLTGLAVLQADKRRLPEHRAELFEWIITWMSQARRGVPESKIALSRLRHLAFEMQESGQVAVSLDQAARHLVPLFPAVPGRTSLEQAGEFLETEPGVSGILTVREGKLQYWHRRFQELLAARKIAGLNEAEMHELVRTNQGRTEWREVILLLGRILYDNQTGADRVQSLIDSLFEGDEPDWEDGLLRFALVTSIVEDLTDPSFHPRHPRYAALAREARIVFQREGQHLDFQVRLAAAEALGQYGDPRLKEDNWVTIPACTFLMGAQEKNKKGDNYDAEAYDWEQHVHPVTLRFYEIARFPVTVAEYADFVKEGGPLPGNWGLQKRHRNRPVVEINWHDAVAYCGWLSGKTGRKVRLPTEAEWERAARGPGNTKYPWGADRIDPSRANYRDSRIGAATPVGLYPDGANRERIFDLIGNVWEWCSDWFNEKGYAPDPVTNPQGPKNGNSRVLRGGSWVDNPRYCRASCRGGNRPDLRSDNIGFRCVRELRSLDT